MSYFPSMWNRSLVALLIARFFSSLGYFGLMAILALILLKQPFSYAPAQIATLLGLFALADRGTSVLWVPVIARLSHKRSMLLGFTISGLSLGSISFVQDFLFSLVMIVLFGFGLALSNLVMRLWAASPDGKRERMYRLSLVYRMLNFASGVGPVLVFAVPYNRHPLELISVAALCSAVSFIAIQFGFIDEARSPEKIRVRELVAMVKAHLFRSQVVLAVYALTFLFAFSIFQYFILPYYFELYYEVPSWMGWAMALNPFMIVFLQGKVSKLFLWFEQRRLHSGHMVGTSCMVTAFACFALMPGYVGIWPFMALLTFGEMLSTPHFDYTLTNHTPRHFHSYLIALSGIFLAMGRAAAEGGGVAALTALHADGFGPGVWWMLNALFLAAAIALGLRVMFRTRSRADL